MGNALPARCTLPCNPICCNMCMNVGDVQAQEHPPVTSHSAATPATVAARKRAAVFASAASALSVESEEIALDDHLQVEVAGEVQLWRMETTGEGIHASLHGGPRDGATFEPPFGGRDRSASPPPRTQVCLHDRGVLDGSEGRGGRPRSRSPSRRPADSAGVAAEVGPSTAPAEEQGQRSGVCSGEGAPASLPSRAVAPAAGASAGGCGDAAGGEEAACRGLGAGPGCTPQVVFPGCVERAAEDPAGGATQASSLSPVAPSTSAQGSPAQLSGASVPADEGPPTPSHFPRREFEDSTSSSEESSFAGFIEDPVENQRCSEQQRTPEYLEAEASFVPTTPFSDAEGVRSDRSRF